MNTQITATVLARYVDRLLEVTAVLSALDKAEMAEMERALEFYSVLPGTAWFLGAVEELTQAREALLEQAAGGVNFMNPKYRGRDD